MIEHDPTKVMDALALVIGSVYTLDDQADTVVRVKVDVEYTIGTKITVRNLMGIHVTKP